MDSRKGGKTLKDEEMLLHLAMVMHICNISLLHKCFTSLQMMKGFLGQMGREETGTERSLKTKTMPWFDSTLTEEEPSTQDFVMTRLY